MCQLQRAQRRRERIIKGLENMNSWRYSTNGDCLEEYDKTEVEKNKYLSLAKKKGIFFFNFHGGEGKK